MKKRMLKLLIPVKALVLTSCNLSVRKEKGANNFNATESTDANDELFLDAPIQYLDNPYDPEVEYNDISVGMQVASNQDGSKNFRFLAAIKVVDMDGDADIDNDDLAETSAVWSRGVFYNDKTNSIQYGNAVKEYADKASTKAYTTINAGGSPYTIADYNTDHGTNYTHFVTYVLKNVPNDSNNYLLNVSLTVNGTNMSKKVVVTADETTKFVYDSSPGETTAGRLHAAILVKRTDGSFNRVGISSANASGSGSNARYSGTIIGSTTIESGDKVISYLSSVLSNVFIIVPTVTEAFDSYEKTGFVAPNDTGLLFFVAKIDNLRFSINKRTTFSMDCEIARAIQFDFHVVDITLLKQSVERISFAIRGDYNGTRIVQTKSFDNSDFSSEFSTSVGVPNGFKLSCDANYTSIAAKVVGYETFMTSNHFTHTGFTNPKGNRFDVTLYNIVDDQHLVTNLSNGEETPTFNGSVVTYGMYPQSVVSDSSLITALDHLADEDIDYTGWYEYNNEHYTKLVATPYDSNSKFIDGATIVADTTYWFKCEPVTWQQLDYDSVNGARFVVANKLYDAIPYTTNTYKYNYQAATIHRTYLEKDFLYTAFVNGGACINVTEVDCSVASGSAQNYTCNNQFDRLFLLSKNECNNASYGFVNDAARVCSITDYARAQGAKIDGNNNDGGIYWTRSSSDENKVWYVDGNGAILDTYEINANELKGACGRPAMWVRA